MKKNFFGFSVSRLRAAALLFPAAVFFACNKSADPIPVVPAIETDIGGQAPAFSPEETAASVQDETGASDAPEKTAVPGAAAAVSTAAVVPAANREVPLLTGIRARPFGVFIGELDPVNYDTVDPAILLEMGLGQDHVSFIMGERYFKAGNYDKALAEYDRAIALNASFPVALFSRGRAYHKKGDLDRTIADYSGAIRLQGDSVVVYNYRGYAYAQKGDHARAIEDYSRAIALKADYGDAWFNRGFSHWERGDYDRAIADFTRLIELEPKNAAVYNQRGTAWYSRGEDRKAVEDFSEAIRLNQNYPLAWHNRAVAWRALGDYARAEKDAAEAARLGYR
ncbi:MAG: tetratricopeptide repeat protein [Treponema sp.]|nr:tetratricopeptide repeat protein [Treponema sp.]